MGTASLRINDLEGHEALTPWLGGVYVQARERGQGIGKALCKVVEERAFELGFKKLFLFTLDKVDWYRMGGWVIKEEVKWHGYPGVLMEKRIG